MLCSSLSQKSDAVSVDLLTRAQLELLYSKRTNTQNATSISRNPNNRYLILTYTSEFDKVQYPLPLQYEQPSVDKLRDTIKRLRQELSGKVRYFETYTAYC